MGCRNGSSSSKPVPLPAKCAFARTVVLYSGHVFPLILRIVLKIKTLGLEAHLPFSLVSSERGPPWSSCSYVSQWWLWSRLRSPAPSSARSDAGGPDRPQAGAARLGATRLGWDQVASLIATLPRFLPKYYFISFFPFCACVFWSIINRFKS
jgi:hypothetical protein